MNLENLKTFLKNQPRYRLEQVNKAVFQDFISDFDEIKNLPKDLREILKKNCSLEINAIVEKSKNSKTEKALMTLDDSEKIETVLMKHEDNRNTVCVSSQVGCPMKCSFCATGQLGFKRNLSPEEIYEQVILFERRLKEEQRKVTNVVFMGMGEPFLNFANVIAAIKIINGEIGIGIRKISISTCGIIDGIEKLIKENMQVNLAISLHAPSDAIREKIMPVNKNYPIKKLLGTVRNYIGETNRRVMFEYVMLKDVNDTAKTAAELAGVLKKYLDTKYFWVNLISYNRTGIYKPSSSETMQSFKHVLEKERISVTQRYKFGREIEGACGQLAATGKSGQSPRFA